MGRKSKALAEIEAGIQERAQAIIDRRAAVMARMPAPADRISDAALADRLASSPAAQMKPVQKAIAMLRKPDPAEAEAARKAARKHAAARLRATIVRDARRGVPPKVTAEKLGITYGYVRVLRCQYGVTKPRRTK